MKTWTYAPDFKFQGPFTIHKNWRNNFKSEPFLHEFFTNQDIYVRRNRKEHARCTEHSSS